MAGGFIKVELRTGKGDLVQDVTIPEFMVAPAVLVWGERYFRRQSATLRSVEGDIYIETFVYHVVPVPGVDSNGFIIKGGK